MIIDLNEKQLAALGPSLQEMQVLKNKYAEAEKKLSEVITGIISSYDYKPGSGVNLNLDKNQIEITEPVVPNRATKRATVKGKKK